MWLVPDLPSQAVNEVMSPDPWGCYGVQFLLDFSVRSQVAGRWSPGWVSVVSNGSMVCSQVVSGYQPLWGSVLLSSVITVSLSLSLSFPPDSSLSSPESTPSQFSHSPVLTESKSAVPTKSHIIRVMAMGCPL